MTRTPTTETPMTGTPTTEPPNLFTSGTFTKPIGDTGSSKAVAFIPAEQPKARRLGVRRPKTPKTITTDTPKLVDKGRRRSLSTAEDGERAKPARSKLWTAMTAPGLRIPRHRATTAHASALYPFHTDSGLGTRGVYIGEDVSAGGSSWCYDPFQLYTDKVISSPNIVVLGMVGSGKSSAVKTYLYRSIGLLGSGAGEPRWCGILDPKGEYGPLADALGLSRLALKPGGQIRLNPLDPGPYTESIDDLRSRRTQMVGAMAAAVLHRELRPTEDAALGWAIDEITIRPNTDRVPTLHDVVALLMHPTELMVTKARMESDAELSREISDVRHALGKLLDGHLRGMFDGPTTESISWDGRGVVIDLSSVHTDPDALTVVMIAAMGWFQSLLAAPQGEETPRRVQVWEEIWALLGQERTAKYFQSCQKLSRDYGVANISVAHRIADLRAQTDDGTAAAKVSMGLLADTQTRILFRQSADQVPEAVEMLGLTAVEAQILPRLAVGRALWQVSDHKAVVQHRIGSTEWPITLTDANLNV